MTSGQPTGPKNTSQATPGDARATGAPPASPAELLDIAVAAADAAARVVRARARDAASIPWQVKSQSDFVSEVDTAAEHAIRAVIGARLPEAVVIGEELTPHAVAHGVTFIADPLDGTTNFLHGYPAYAVSVAAAADGVLEAGVVIDVTRDEQYTAARGGGAWRGGERLSVSAIADPSRALVGTGFPFKHLHLLDVYQRQLAAVIRGTAGVRRAGSAALDLADVACGRFDAFWELMLAPWDMAAGILLVREAGGVLTDLDGRDLTGLSHGPVVAGNPTTHAWLLEMIAQASGHS